MDILDDVDMSVPGGEVKTSRSLVVKVVKLWYGVDQTLDRRRGQQQFNHLPTHTRITHARVIIIIIIIIIITTERDLKHHFSRTTAVKCQQCLNCGKKRGNSNKRARRRRR